MMRPRPASAVDGPLDRVCVVMMSAMGNAVMVLPVLNAIKRHHPAAHVSWIMQPRLADLVAGHPAVDEIIPFQRRRGIRGLLDLRRALDGRRFDVVLDFQMYLKAGLVTGITSAPVKVGFDRARAKELNWLFTTHRIAARPPRHRQDEYLDFLEPLGIPREPPVWKLGPWPHERAAQQELLARFERPVVPLVVSGTRAEMSWVPDRWAPLADALYDLGLQPVLVGGRSSRELEVERAITERAGRPVVSMLGCDVRTMVGLLEGAALVVSVDTGPMHMAAAVGTPVVALLGHFNPLHTGPYGYGELMVDAYGDPGEVYSASYARRKGRMARIGVRDVMEKVALALDRYPSSSPGGQSSP
jgi:heptosyltransferase I